MIEEPTEQEIHEKEREAMEDKVMFEFTPGQAPSSSEELWWYRVRLISIVKIRLGEYKSVKKVVLKSEINMFKGRDTWPGLSIILSYF